MAKRVQLMTNTKEWQTVDGVEVLIDIPQEDLDPITDSSCVEIEGHRTLEETISQENMFTPEIIETKIHSKVGGVYHDNVVDGAYEEAILYGNTQVNLVESVTADTKYIPHSFTSFQGNESKIGNYNSGRTNQVAPLVKGVTMVNLCQETSLTIQYQHTRVIANRNAKPNTKYTLKCKFTEKNKKAGIMIQSYGYKDGTWGYIEISKTIQNLGDDVLLTFTTHEQADSIIIYNNPAFCEDTNDSITLDDIMVIEGDVTDLDLPFFKGMRSVELSRPLTNLFTDDLHIYNSGVTSTISNGNITVTSTGIATWAALNIYFKDVLKPHTQYLVMWDSLSYNHTGSALATIAVYDDNGRGISEINKPSTQCPTLRSLVFDTKDYDVNYIKLRIHATTTNSETGTTIVKGLRVFEWDDSLRTLDLQTIGYFSGTKYVSVRALETEGKNLYPYGDVNFTSEFASSWCDSKGNAYMAGDIASKSQARFLLRKGTYYLSNGSNSNVAAIQLVDDKENLLISPFTLAQDTYCTIRVKTIEANVATTITNIQIERGETATTYEAYQSRYYKPRETEEIILRSLPNGVCDTFNLQTGELVQRIGEVVLDGSEHWTINATYKYFCNSIRSDHKSRSKGGMAISDKIIYLSSEQIVTNSIRGFSMGGSEFIQLCEPSCTTVDELKTYLQSSPITVQYELAEPIITKLQTYARVYSGQTNARANMGNNLSALTYYSSNYYLKVANLSPVPAILEPITSIPYDVRLKPSTSYTIKYNRGGHSNSMKFDLGGSIVEKTNATDLSAVAEELTVKTPAILSHEQLILSGTGYAHNFIVVEGDITGTELPYFEGMKDVKMPIVKNVSRNLLDESSMRVFYESGITLRTYDVFACKPNTRYCFVSIGGEANCNWHVCKKDAHYERPENESVGITQYLGYSREIVTPQDCYYMCIHTGSSPTTDREVYDIKTAIYEGSFAECVNYGYEDYKENSIYITQGEIPITSEMIEQGGFSTGNPTSDGSYETMKYGEENGNYLKRLRSKNLIPVKPNTTYAFAHSFSRFIYNVYQWNGNKRFIDGTSQKFTDGQVETITTTADTQYIHFLMSKDDISQNITVGEYDWSQFHMYELDSTINLRSLPNGVKDELNLLTGEYIQRVGEVVFDGSDDEDWNVYTDGDFALTPFFHITFFNWLDGGSCTNKYHNAIKISSDGELGYCIYGNGVSNNIPRAILRVRTNEIVNGLTIESWKEELKISPLILQYKLAEPIISHVRLVSNNQEREVGVKLPNGVCNTYNPSTGMTTVRVGKIVLDGSEDEGWKTAADNSGGAFRFETQLLSGKFNGTTTDTEAPILLCDKYATYKFYLIYKGEKVGISFYMSSHIVIYDNKYGDLASFKQALQSDPITVWYELKYPQIQPDIVLPNGVHDEYNPETGVYTKKVGFFEFDGSADEGWRAAQTDPNRFVCEILTDRKYYSSDVIKDCMLCDKITVVSYKELYGTDGTDGVYGIAPFGSSANIQMRLEGITTAEQLQQYLSQNPIKLWYELQTPITYQLTPYFALPQPYAYEDGYLIHESAYPETTLPPEFKYKLVANRTGQVMQNNRKLQDHTTRLSNLEALIIEATIESLFNRELQLFELELMDIQLIDLGE